MEASAALHRSKLLADLLANVVALIAERKSWRRR